MRAFFDNCTSPVLAGILDALIRPRGDRAWHIRFMPADYAFAGDTPDPVWIERLAADRPADWIVMTADGRISRNKAERLAWRRSGLRGFVFASGFEKMPLHQRASVMLFRWPEMARFIGSTAPGSLFELPVGRNSGFKSLAV